MADNEHRVPIDEDALQRLLDGTQNLQRRIFRLSRRGFMTPAAIGQMRYDGESISRDLTDLIEQVGRDRG